MSKTDPTSQETQEQPTVSIRFTMPGIVSIGAYQNGVIYEVPVDEAERLIAVKGFERMAEKATEF